MTTTANPLLENCCPSCNNCPDDWEITEAQTLPANDCGGGCCGECNDKWGCNIVSTNECLDVDTSECGVVKLTAICPPVVVAWENVTVDVEDCDLENCSKKYIVNAECEDEKVKACSWDTTPGYLNQKLVAGDWIQISEIGCDWQTDSKLRISVAPDVYDNTDEMVAVSSDCSPWYLEDVLVVNSSYIKAENVWCKLLISDKTPKLHYAKVYLTHDWQSPSIVPMNTWWSTMLWNSWSNPAVFEVDWLGQNRMLSWMTVDSLWHIVAQRRGLYLVGFSGSIELNYWIHALRAQLYRTDTEASSYYTIIESRYSWVLWDQPFEVNGSSGSKIWKVTYVSNVSWWWEEAVSQTKRDYNIDTPLLAQQTESWGQAWHWKSQSLGAFLDRFAFWGATIAILNKWDKLVLGVKANTEVNPDGSLLWQVPTDYRYWHLAVLWRSWESDYRIWWEPWAQIFASLLQPLS